MFSDIERLTNHSCGSLRADAIRPHSSSVMCEKTEGQEENNYA
jgi:hypothetical protein